MTHFHRQYGGEKAVLWAFSDYDESGRPEVSAAVEIDVVAWNEGRQEAIGPDAVPISIDASCEVFRDVAEGGVLWRGDKRDLPTDTADLTNLRQVVSCNAVQDVKGLTTNRTVGMVKLDSLPTVV